MLKSPASTNSATKYFRAQYLMLSKLLVVLQKKLYLIGNKDGYSLLVLYLTAIRFLVLLSLCEKDLLPKLPVSS